MQFIKKIWFFAIFILAALSLGYYGMLMYYNQYSYWADEVYSINLFKANVVQLLAMTAGDVHPPLYYILGKLFSSIWGYSGLSFRLFSYLFYCLTILMTVSIVRREFGDITAIITIIFISLPVTALEHVLSARPYEIARFFVTACFLYGYKALKYKKPCYWCIFTISAIAAAYTHYFALIEVAFIVCGVYALSLYKRENFRECIITAAVCILTYLPWLGTLVKTFARKNGSGWLMSYPDLYECLMYIYGRADGLSLIMIILLAITIVLFILRGVFRQIERYIPVEKDIITVMVIALSCILGTCVTGIVVSEICSPCIHTRSLYPLTAVAAVLLGGAVNYWLQRLNTISFPCSVLLTIIILLGTCASFAEKCEYYQHALVIKKDGNDTLAAVERLKEIDPSETLATNLIHLWWNVLDYYIDYKDCFIYTGDTIQSYEGNTIYCLMGYPFNAENTEWLREKGWTEIEYEGAYTLAGYHYHLYYLTK